MLLQLPSDRLHGALLALASGEPADGDLLPPLEEDHEVWASGVTYMRSREARMAESDTRDVYDKVYDAERPELFFKAAGRRAVGHGAPVRIRADSRWNVPEPELVVVANRAGEIVGYTAGNDMSSRDIEGANPLYLPQAKVYDGACAVGPGIVVCSADEMRDLPIALTITRSGGTVFAGETSVSRMRRSLDELVSWLYRELEFPIGALLMTGTGVVPGEDFTLSPGDAVRVRVGELTLENGVA
jgi:2-dehydro-3-deoxy-D-arabinonate dehydratase